MAKYSVLNQPFKTKDEIVKAVRDILYRYTIGSSLNAPDKAFITDLLENHPRADEKIGVGIAKIRVIENEHKNGTNGFEIVRLDRTVTDFSYVKCIFPKSELSDLKAACRTAVSEDILSFKNKQFDLYADKDGMLTCPLTGEKITKFNSHIDHKKPNTFDNIVKSWLTQNSFSPSTIKILGYQDGDVSKRFADGKLSESFRTFHRNHADLRVTSMRGNLSESKKEIGNSLMKYFTL